MSHLTPVYKEPFISPTLQLAQNPKHFLLHATLSVLFLSCVEDQICNIIRRISNRNTFSRSRNRKSSPFLITDNLLAGRGHLLLLAGEVRRTDHLGVVRAVNGKQLVEQVGHLRSRISISVRRYFELDRDNGAMC